MTTNFPGRPDHSFGDQPVSPGIPEQPQYGVPASQPAPEVSDYGTHNLPAGSPLDAPGGPHGKGEAAKQEASRLADEAKDATSSLTDTVKDEARNLADTAKTEARGLVDTAKSQLDEQARTQQAKAAETTRAIGDDMDRIARGEAPQNELLTQFAATASSTVQQAAAWLEDREPQDLLAEAQSFARRKPVTFLLICAGLGLVAGRLTRGMIGNPGEDDSTTVPTTRTTRTTASTLPSETPTFDSTVGGGMPPRTATLGADFDAPVPPRAPGFDAPVPPVAGDRTTTGLPTAGDEFGAAR